MTAVRHALDESFGRETVAPEERKSRIRRMFDRIAPRYDLMNDLMSFGIHRLWKRRLARRAAGSHGIVVDLAGGTGDVARLLDGCGRRVIVCDPSVAMMQAGRRACDQRIHWLAGEAEALPFPDCSIDVLTIAFGIRNVTRLSAALAEIHRVLVPGGRFICLEFSRPAPLIAPFYDAYSHLVIPRLGAAIARAPGAYQYLIESIRRFPDQREFAGLIAEAGFTDVHWENLSFGIACLHFGQKPSASA
ncbi:class I SAM-dependent methyltransferase [Sulfuricystis multivorans]|uniref:class I SAM-dependent methyltransferase n=1 Tax=Sulfuricystis multivorans TaxID=2211108 RepID=UPI000F81CE70|nr:class I SAM-dependent methyltransferase [Sulfuricystis multivorans]